MPSSITDRLHNPTYGTVTKHSGGVYFKLANLPDDGTYDVTVHVRVKIEVSPGVGHPSVWLKLFNSEIQQLNGELFNYNPPFA